MSGFFFVALSAHELLRCRCFQFRHSSIFCGVEKVLAHNEPVCGKGFGSIGFRKGITTIVIIELTPQINDAVSAPSK